MMVDYSAKRVCTIVKSDDEEFEFSIKPDVQRKGLVIDDVMANGPAKRAGLKKEDRILDVNGNDVTRCDFKKVVELIRGRYPKNKISLTVIDKRNDPNTSKSDDPIPRLCKFKVKSNFGFSVGPNVNPAKTGHFITVILKGGPAEKSGLKLHDRLVAVNGVNVDKISLFKVVLMIIKSESKLKILVIEPDGYDALTAKGVEVTSDLIKNGSNKVGIFHLFKPRDKEHVMPKRELWDQKIEKLQPGEIAECCAYKGLYNPRLCKITTKYSGFGFFLRDENGHILGNVEEEGPAAEAGVLNNDQIVEVNGINVEKETHEQVVARIRASDETLTLLVAGKERKEESENNFNKNELPSHVIPMLKPIQQSPKSLIKRVIYNQYGMDALLTADTGSLFTMLNTAYSCDISEEVYGPVTPFKNKLVPYPIQISIEIGDITKTACQYIVRTTDSSYGFGGQVSNAIVQNGGPSIEKECMRKLSSQTVSHNVITTDAGTLPCIWILHAVYTNVEETVQNILTVAKENDIRNLNLPVIGAGNAGLYYEDCISAMKTAIDEWSKNNQWDMTLTIMLFTDVTSQHIKAAVGMFSPYTKLTLTYSYSEETNITAIMGCVDYYIGQFLRTVEIKNVPQSIYDDDCCKTIEEIADNNKVLVFVESHGCLSITGDVTKIELPKGEIENLLKKYNEEMGKRNSEKNGPYPLLPKIVEISPLISECSALRKLFNGGSVKQYHILKIEQVLNSTVFKSYENHKSVVRSKYPGEIIERRLFHGTSHDTIDKIYKEGFDRNHGGKHGLKLGNGVYFSSSVDYSNNFSSPNKLNERKMIIANVLTGKFCKGYEGLKTPPSLPNNDDEKYDSVVNDENNPEIFVVFRDWCAYPSYVVTYNLVQST